MGNKRLKSTGTVDKQLLKILQEYIEDHNKGFPAIAIGWDDNGFVFVYHEHWRYCSPTHEAPRVYVGGRFNKPDNKPYHYLWLD